MPGNPRPAAPTEQESALALESSRKLARALEASPEAVRIRIESAGKKTESITVPAAALRQLKDVLAAMARGDAVALIPMHTELSTQEAADLLNVSRPFLVRLLDDGTIPGRKVGTHRRVRVEDVARYKERVDRERLKALDALSAQAQELGMGYEP